MPILIVNDISPRIQITAAAGQTVFTYNFLIFLASDLAVYQTPAGQAPNDTLDLLVYQSNYSVQNVGSLGGGTITLSLPANAGDTITIERNMPLNRTTDYSDAGSFKAASVNMDFDRCIMMTQQINSKLTGRGLLYAHSATIPSGMNTLPVLAANQIWQANGLGNGIAAVTIDESQGWSTLRSELASNTQLAPGTDLVGFYDDQYGMNATTLDAFLRRREYAEDTGVANAYVITLNPGPAELLMGQRFVFKASHPNTGPSTLNVNSLGPINITLQGTVLAGGEISDAGTICDVVFDGLQFMLLSVEARPAVRFQLFTANGNFTVPPGITTVYLTGVGAGGSGGGGSATAGSPGIGGGGGGAGQSCFKQLVTVTSGAVINIAIGIGGAAVAANTIGNAGSNTTFGALLTLNGGGAGINGGGGAMGGAAGGAGSTAGGGGGVVSYGIPGGMGGSSFFGGGAAGGSTPPAGITAMCAGTGGGGGGNNGAGGAGANGQLLVEW